MLNFSILGYGHIGKVHRVAIEQTQGSNLISIIDPFCQEEIQGVKIYHSLDEFLNEDTLTDIVSIATPNGLHAQHAIACLQAGKHVLIEKPIALNLKDAEEIIKASKLTGKRVFSSMQLRFSPSVQFVKNLLDNNDLGQIYMVNVHCYWNRNKEYYQLREWHGTQEMDGGVLFTQFSHFVDILNFWFDDLKVVNASFFNFNHQQVTEFSDSGKIDFEAGDTQGNMIFTTSVYEKNYESAITILAEKGTIKIGDQYLNELKYCNVEGISEEKNHSTETRNFHPRAIEEIINALQENRPSVLDGEHALRLVKFIEDAYALG